MLSWMTDSGGACGDHQCMGVAAAGNVHLAEGLGVVPHRPVTSAASNVAGQCSPQQRMTKAQSWRDPPSSHMHLLTP